MSHEHKEGETCKSCEATRELVEDLYEMIPDDKDVSLAAISGLLALVIDDTTPIYRKNSNQAKKVMQEVADYAASILDGRGWNFKTFH